MSTMTNRASPLSDETGVTSLWTTPLAGPRALKPTVCSMVTIPIVLTPSNAPSLNENSLLILSTTLTHLIPSTTISVPFTPIPSATTSNGYSAHPPLLKTTFMNTLTSPDSTPKLITKMATYTTPRKDFKSPYLRTDGSTGRSSPHRPKRSLHK